MSTEKSIFITEEEKLKLHLQTTYTERFYLLMQLIKPNEKKFRRRPDKCLALRCAEKPHCAIACCMCSFYINVLKTGVDFSDLRLKIVS